MCTIRYLCLHIQTLAHITSFDSGHMFVGRPVSQLDNKHSNSVVVGIAIFIFDYNFCEDGRKVGIATQVSGPPFRGCLSWSVQIEAIRLLVKSSSRLNPCNI